MSFASAILAFLSTLKAPNQVPKNVAVLWPFDNPEVIRIRHEFYQKFFADTRKRIFLIGINPGRYGAGVTGIGFTDPIHLAADCGIPHELPGGRELSGDFIYEMIQAFGGAAEFYRHFYITALSPLGYTRDGKNLNYYDVKEFPDQLDEWMADAMAAQIKAGCDRRVAFSLGRGAHFKQLEKFNQRHDFFERIEPLPHPRWVMQYRRKRLSEFIEEYVSALREAL